MNGHGTKPMGPAATRNRSNYRLVKEAPGMVWIVDVDDGGKSVTNDAEAVTAELAAAFPNCQFFYRDSDGEWAELCHNNGIFTGFGDAQAPQL